MLGFNMTKQSLRVECKRAFAKQRHGMVQASGIDWCLVEAIGNPTTRLLIPSRTERHATPAAMAISPTQFAVTTRQCEFRTIIIHPQSISD